MKMAMNATKTVATPSHHVVLSQGCQPNQMSTGSMAASRR